MKEESESTAGEASGEGRALLLDELQELTRDLVSVALASLKNVDAVTLPEMRLLLAVRGRPQGSGLELARALGTSPASVSRHADKLVRRGLLSRETDPTNRRIVRFDLTAPGEDAVAQVLQARARALAVMVARLDDETASRTAHALRRLRVADQPPR